MLQNKDGFFITKVFKIASRISFSSLLLGLSLGTVHAQTPIANTKFTMTMDASLMTIAPTGFPMATRGEGAIGYLFMKMNAAEDGTEAIVVITGAPKAAPPTAEEEAAAAASSAGASGKVVLGARGMFNTGRYSCVWQDMVMTDIVSGGTVLPGPFKSRSYVTQTVPYFVGVMAMSQVANLEPPIQITETALKTLVIQGSTALGPRLRQPWEKHPMRLLVLDAVGRRPGKNLTDSHFPTLNIYSRTYP